MNDAEPVPGVPPDAAATPARRDPRGIIIPAVETLAVITVFLAWSWSEFGSPKRAMAYLAGQRLVVEPQILDLRLGPDSGTYESVREFLHNE